MKRRTLLRLTGASIGAAFPSLIGASVSGCLDGASGGTTGQRIRLAARAELASPLAFETSLGLAVTLERVLVSIGSLTYFAGAPLELAARGPTMQRRLLGLVLPRSAHAHPGHYVPGEARGELLAPSSFDLATGPVELGEGEGTTGLVRSARLVLGDPPVGALASELGSAVLAVVATLSQGERSVRLRLEAKASALVGDDAVPEIDGCRFEETTLDGDGAVVLAIDPRIWLEQVELDDTLVADGEEPLLAPAESLASRAFVRGVQKTAGYHFRFEA